MFEWVKIAGVGGLLDKNKYIFEKDMDFEGAEGRIIGQNVSSPKIHILKS